MDEEKVQILFETFRDEFGLKSIDGFKNYLSDPTKRKMFYDEVIQPRYPGNSFEAFENLYGLKKNENFNQDTDSPSESGTSGFFDSSQSKFATEVPKGEGFKKFKSALKTTVSGLARLPVSLRELDVSIRQSLDPEFKKEYNKLSVEDREKILSTTPGVGISGKIPTPLIGVDDTGEEVSEYYGGSKAIEFSQRQQEQANIINESLAKFETSIGQDLFSIENTGRGTRRLINEVAGAIPSLVLAMTPGGIYALGASAGSGKSRTLQDEGEDLTVSRYINAVGTGVAEGYFEKFTRGLGNSSFKILKQLYKEGGASKVKESFTSIVYNFLKGFNIEGTSEVMTDVSERALDLVLTGDEKAFENFFLETADTYIIGGAAGGPVKVAGPGMRLIQQQAQINNLGKKVSESQYSDLVNVFKPETGDFTVDISKLPIVEAPNSELFLNETLKREVKKGKITQLEMQEIMDNYNIAQNINSQLEGAELSDADKNKAAGLLQEQITLQELVKDKNPALFKKQRDRIAAIDQELEIISETQFGIETEQQATREEAEKALLDEGVESPTEEQVLLKLDEIIQQSAPVTTTIPKPDTETETEVKFDEDIDVVPPNELPLQKVLRKDDVIREKIQDEKSDASQRKKATLELISKLQPKGEVFARRAKSLIKEVAKLNFKNPVKVNQFIKKIDKTFDDAVLKKELKDAKNLKLDINKKLVTPKGKKNQDKIKGNLVGPAKAFLEINPNNVENLKEYLDYASKLNEGLKTTTRKFIASPFVVSEIDEYSSREIKKIKQKELELEEETYKALMGDLKTTIPLKELKSLLYPDSELSLEEKQTMANKKEKEIRSSLAKGFDSIGGVIRSIIDTGVDPFSNEVIEINKEQKDLIEKFLEIDINKLTTEESARALDALNNFATNGSLAGVGKIVNNYQGNLNREKNIKDNLQVTNSRFEIKEGVENKFLIGIASTTQAIDFAFKSREKSNTFQNDSGFSRVQANFAKAETAVNKIKEDFKNEFPDDRRTNKEAFNTEENITERGMFAFVRRSTVGTAKDIQKEFDRRKQLILNDIIAFEKSTEADEIELGRVYRQIFDKILKDANNPLEVQANVDPVNVEAVEWMTEKWTEIKPLLDKVALEIYNRELGSDINYTSDVFTKKITKDIPDLDAPISSEMSEGRKIYDKETGVFKTVFGPSILVDRYVNLNFDSGQLNNMKKALSDAYSAESIAQLKGYLESADINKILGDGNVKKIIIRKITEYINSKRGNRYREVDERAVSQFADFAATVGTSRVLGGPTQFVKQTTPLVNTFVNAGGEITSAAMEKFIMSKGFRDLVKNSGTAIANRGLGSSVVIDNLQENVKKKANTPIKKIKQFGNKLFGAIKKANRWFLEKFLLTGDKFAANVSWLAYYGQEMREKGIDIFEEGFDVENHTLNKEAADNAQRQVDRFQYVSDPDLQGYLYNPANDDIRIAMKAVMPFSSFIMNEKTRNYIDASILASTTTSVEEKQKAATSLSGTFLEKTVFHSLGLGISTYIAISALKLLGLYDEEKEKEKFENRVKGRAGNFVSDFISPIPIADNEVMTGINILMEYFNNPDPLSEESPFQFYEGRPEGLFEQLGVYTIGADQARYFYDLDKMNREGAIGEYQLNPAEKEAVKVLLKLASLNLMGAVPTEIASGVRTGVARLQELAKNAKFSGDTSTPMTKGQRESILGEEVFKEIENFRKERRDIKKQIKDEFNIF